MQKMLVVLKKGTLYTAGVFTESGLYSSALPRSSLDEAIKAVGGIGLQKSNSEEYIETLKAAFAIWDGHDYPDIGKIKLDFSGMTEKQRRVLEAARKIKRGSTMTYGELAEAAGLPNAARFVGNVMAQNRHSPFIPCHRVVAKNGLGGFGAGLSLKAKMLKQEGAFAD